MDVGLGVGVVGDGDEVGEPRGVYFLVFGGHPQAGDTD